MTHIRKETIETDIKIGDTNVARANVVLLNVPLTEPFKISLGTVYDYSGTILELDSGNESGFGEGSTIQEITGEVPAAVYETVLQILKQLKGNRYLGVEEFLEDVYKSVYSSPTAKNAVDMAVHDLITKSIGIHLTNFLGGGLKSIPTSLTIGLGSVEESLRSLDELKKIKTRIVKVKVGKDAGLDIKRIRAISEHLDGRDFYVDANQGYKLRDAYRVAQVLRDTGALFFEQPMDKHNLQDLRLLRRQSDIPIMLDESISEPFDVVNAILNESADLINVKLTKSGGIRKAFKTLVTAQSYGIDAMVGCMVESKLGIAASLSVASSLSNVKYTDLDGFHSISRQPFDGGLEYESGVNTPATGTGLACIPVKERW
ncbi:MAG: dipeptide epimerase [Thermoplasmatales archaeon]|nr:dipeptide epimerase [Thermoplasmatales archaeon]